MPPDLQAQVCSSQAERKVQRGQQQTSINTMKLVTKKPTAATAASTAEIDLYKGNPMLVLKSAPDTKWPFQFGMSKAKLILAHIKQIESFVASNGAAL